MRRVRLAYEGSFHHVMNRGLRGEDIFFDNRAKAYFLEVMAEQASALKIRILAYCVMDNHYHLVLQNVSGKLSEYMKQVNGQYGMYYRKRRGGMGYVFQGRFKSILIQEDKYLRMVLLYILLNPVRGKKVSYPRAYPWSSVQEYFAGGQSSTVDSALVEAVFETRVVLYQELKGLVDRELPVMQTRYGEVLGDERYVETAIKTFNRRKQQSRSLRMRQNDVLFRSLEQVMQEFKCKHGVAPGDIDCSNHHGKALRSQLLVALKDEAGMTYSEIIQVPIFQTLKCNSLGQIYRRTKAKTVKC